MAGAVPEITDDAIAAAREAGAGEVRRTPVLLSRTAAAASGGPLALKAENLQRTGSFKLRGALAKLAALGADASAGVVAGSAGNHAQSVAYAARARGVRCEVFMPPDAPIAKAEAVADLGAIVHQEGASVSECVELAKARGQAAGMAFVHPFDDLDVIAGQATLGLELVEQVPDLAMVVVPLGGGGLACGTAIAVKRTRPDCRVVGVQVAGCAPYPASLAAGEARPAASALTIADGIAVKRPGELTLPLAEAWLDDVVVVEEEDVADAMVHLLERSKLVVEGAGAVGVAALRSGRVSPAPDGRTVAVLSGGNVDVGLLAVVARRHETEMGRRLVLFTRVPDRPGGLAAMLDEVAAAGGNVVDVDHVREGVDLSVRETGIQLVVETRGRAHADALLAALREHGYETRVLG